MQKVKEKIKSLPVHILILIGIILFGILLRTYHYDDWMRFNADQSRDAAVVSSFLDGRNALPLLGPKAGGTEFKLGGMFYHFQIISAKIFGNVPDKMGYPDLFAGILTIPLIYLLARRYFKTNIALALSLIASVSPYLIKYSRFAWNPNSGPFYTLLFLYALLMLADEKKQNKNWWIMLAGISLGVGVQLHTLMMVIMPIVSVLFFIYVGKKDFKIWKKALVIFAIAVLLNTGQIVSEVKSGGENIQAFFGGATSKTSGGSSIAEDFIQSATCQIQSNAYIISGIGDNDECGTSLISGGFKKAKGLINNFSLAIGLLLTFSFTLGGIWFWVKAIKKEKEENKRLMLLLTGTYASVGFLLLILLANEISLRFYLAIIFVPFMLLGFWIKEILSWKKQFKKSTGGLIGFLIALLVVTNILRVKTSFDDYANKKLISNSTKTEITLGEAHFLANYIISHADVERAVWVEGKQQYLFKYIRSIEYFTDQKNIKLKALSNDTTPKIGELIVYVGDAKNEGKLTSKLSETYLAIELASYGRFSISTLNKK